MLMVGEAERRRRFGYALQEALKARGVSERQLALRLEIDPRKVARWRTGRDLPNLYETQALVDALRIDEDLFRNPPEVPEAPAYPINDYLLDDADAEEKRAASTAAALVQRRSAGTSGGRAEGDPEAERPARKLGR